MDLKEKIQRLIDENQDPKYLAGAITYLCENYIQLRDKIAMKSLQGLLSSETEKERNASVNLGMDRFSYLSKDAYSFADAMLKQRQL